jgi:hypothetical protein
VLIKRRKLEVHNCYGTCMYGAYKHAAAELGRPRKRPRPVNLSRKNGGAIAATA